jgi:hypothetical protein
MVGYNNERNGESPLEEAPIRSMERLRKSGVNNFILTQRNRLPAIFVALAFGAIGVIAVNLSHAATLTTNQEAENGTVSGCAAKVSDSNASAGQAVTFGGGACNNLSATAGASLPISYSLSSLTGTIYYVSPSGSDSNSGTVGSPFATLSKAVSTAASGATIVLRGGTYRQGGLSIDKTLKIIAYPGETPVFNGAAAVSSSSGWTVSGSLSYRSYTPMPVTDGSGISFSSCQNQSSSCMGRYPDQVWVGSSQYQQVASTGAVTTGKFYVDSTNNRLYMLTTDLSAGSIEISNLRTFATVSAASVTLKGFEFIRYSNTASDYGVLELYGTADNTLVDNIYESDDAFEAIGIAPTGTDLNQHSTVQNSTIVYSNWMGVAANATDYFKLDHDNISNMNQYGEFTASPQSGSLKTSRTWYTSVLNSKIMNDKSNGLWFDQSNYDATVAGNDVENNTNYGVFYEISDRIYVVNNLIKNNGEQGLHISGSSNAYVVNNTFVGNYEQMGLYVDDRSIAGCSDPAQPLCANSYSSDRDTYHTHLATMTWIPTLNLAINNIFAYPAGNEYCGNNNAVCITHTNQTATVDISTILHHADPTNNIPQTVMDGNVYANGTGTLIYIVQLNTYTLLSAFSTAMAGSPVNISGMEALGHAGNSYLNTDGSATSTLTPLESSAYAVPTDTNINPYVPAGTKHYGVLWK